MRRRRARWLPTLLLAGWAGVAPAATAPPPLRPATPAEAAQRAALAPKYRQWLDEVALLISAEERATFLALTADYQRDAFIASFWASRDPYPDTARNERRDEWQAKLEEARQTFGNLDDARARFQLLNGPPAERIELGQRDTTSGSGFRCRGIVVPAEVWFYTRENRTHEEMVLLFFRPMRVGAWRLWESHDGFAALLVPASALSQGRSDSEMRQVILDTCGEAGEALMKALGFIASRQALQYPLQVLAAEAPLPRPSSEWLGTFASYSTDVAEGAQSFDATVSFTFPGRRGSRTLVQGVIATPVAALGHAELGSARTYDLLLTGEVLHEGKLFDRFRYKFDFPLEGVSGARLPLIFQRPLRPGEYRLVVKVEDLNGKKFFRSDGPITVPAVDGVVPPPGPSDPETARLLAEANALIATGEVTVKLLEPVGRDMLAGKVRFDTLVTGDQVATVTFALDGQPILTKRVPPWSVELDLGHLPRSQTLRATAADRDGRPLASDQLVINASAHRFAVTLTEPAPHQHFKDSVRLMAKVEVPEGERVERLELFRDETLVATLYQPPWEQPILLPPGEPLTYLRAVAFLPDGNSTEDHVFINAPAGLEEVSVQLVELYTAVTDRNGRPVDGLGAEQFQVKEDGAAQQVVRFEQVRDLPIKTAILLDTSASMEPSMEEAQQAALSFFSDIVTPKDRAALITFNDRPRLQVKFTNELLALGGGLAGLKAERGTALYDSVVFSLYYFNGLKGQRALVVLSDGKDENSKFTLADTLDFARRAGVTIYTIGLGKELERDARKALEKLSADTGGRTFFVQDAKELLAVYQSIQQELRSQYLLVYQSSNAKTDKKFRTLDVKLKEPGLEAHTIRGYYP